MRTRQYNLSADGQTLTVREVRHLRGKEIAYIFQEPSSSLNPLFTIGSQIAEAIRGAVGAGTYRPGEALPSLRELASALGLDQATAASVFSCTYSRATWVFSAAVSATVAVEYAAAGRVRAVSIPGMGGTARTTMFVSLTHESNNSLGEHMRSSRRDFLARSAQLGVLLGAGVPLLQACGSSSSSGAVTKPIADGLSPEKGPLRIVNYADYINPDVIADFDEKGEIPAMDVFWKVKKEANEYPEPWPREKFFDDRYIKTFSQWAP